MTDYRQIAEQLELERLSPYAMKSRDTRGRSLAETPCVIRTEFQRDRDRIIHSKAFRRLKHKTQVFIAPTGDHYRTRLTHTLEVSQIARTMGRALRLNEDLIEAIALGHDLGHTPFGHGGEAVLNRLHPQGFHHNEQSVRVVELLESGHHKRPGLNLTYEVKNGILNHTGKGKAITLEGQLVRYADRIAYINHDIDDAIRAGILAQEDLPQDLLMTLGQTHSQRINTMIQDVIRFSDGKDTLGMSAKTGEAMMALRQFMFEHVYYNSDAKSEEPKIERLLTDLYNHYVNHPTNLPLEHRMLYEGRENSVEDMATDYIAGMTDHFAITVWKELFVPRAWSMG